MISFEDTQKKKRFGTAVVRESCCLLRKTFDGRRVALHVRSHSFNRYDHNTWECVKPVDLDRATGHTRCKTERQIYRNSL